MAAKTKAKAGVRTGSGKGARRTAVKRSRDIPLLPIAAAGILLAFAIGAGFAGVAGACFAQIFGYVEPAQFDFTVSLMVLAAVVLGGRWGVLGAVVGALGIALYDRVVVEALTAVLHVVGSTLDNAALQAADLRQHNFAVFGVALFLATLYRSRRPA